MAELHATAPPSETVPVDCVLCGEPTSGSITDQHDDDSVWPREYACCPACAYGVADGELYGLLRGAASGPS